MIKVGIVGGTGYTGVELLRLLSAHPEVKLTAITSRKEDGLPVADMFPSLRDHVDLAFSSPDKADLSGCDVVFFATPHGVAMAQAPELLKAGVKVIDLAADFRLKDQATFEKWYKIPETSAQLQRFTGQQVGLIFTPHLVPMIRGMHATLYARLTQDIGNEALQALFEDQYRDAEFVDVMPFGSHPETRSTRGSNMLRIALHRPDNGNTVVILVVQDNLVKGASGQAVQCMNLMFVLPERTGL